MSWLFFMDESGHDHKHCPYEVRGGVALRSTKLWNFVIRPGVSLRGQRLIGRISMEVHTLEMKKLSATAAKENQQ
jgi:hypothetical protein